MIESRVETYSEITERLLRNARWVELPDDGGWVVATCPWCGAHVGDGFLRSRVSDDEVDVIACPECGREAAIIHEGDVKPVAVRLMSPGDMAYLAWREKQGRPATWAELTL